MIFQAVKRKLLCRSLPRLYHGVAGLAVQTEWLIMPIPLFYLHGFPLLLPQTAKSPAILQSKGRYILNALLAPLKKGSDNQSLRTLGALGTQFSALHTREYNSE